MNINKPILAVFFIVVALCQPSYGQSPQSLYYETFNKDSLSTIGWTAFPSGVPGDFEIGNAKLGAIPSTAGYADTRGLILTTKPGQGVTLLGPVIEVGNDPVLVKVSVYASNGGGSVAVGALDAETGRPMGAPDGSVGYSIEVDSAAYMDGYQKVSVLYRPKRNAIVPVLQLAVYSTSNVQSVTVIFDNLVVYDLNASLIENSVLRSIFDIHVPVEPTPTPPATPTPTPTPGEVTIQVDSFYDILPIDDEAAFFSPSVAYDDGDRFAVSTNVESSDGFIDIALKEINNQTKESSPSYIVNELYEDTTALTPDIAIDYSGTRQIVWTDNRSIEKLYSIYLAQFDGFGNKLVENDTTINQLFESTDTESPAIAGKGDGNVTVCWVDDRHFAKDVFVRRLRWTGSTVFAIDENDFQINPPFEDTQILTPDVAMDEDGHIVVAWADDRLIQADKKRFDIYARFFHTNAALTAEGKLPNTYIELQVTTFNKNLANSMYPKIAIANGKCLFAWVDEDQQSGAKAIHAALTTTSGAVLQPEFLIDGTKATQNSIVDVKAINDDLFLILWKDEDVEGLFAKIYDARQHLLLTVGLGLTESDNYTTALSLAVDDNHNFVAFWDWYNAGESVSLNLTGLSGQVLLNDLHAYSTPKSLNVNFAAKTTIKPFKTKPQRAESTIKKRIEQQKLSDKR
jgi:hypothetical protein